MLKVEEELVYYTHGSPASEHPLTVIYAPPCEECGDAQALCEQLGEVWSEIPWRMVALSRRDPCMWGQQEEKDLQRIVNHTVRGPFLLWGAPNMGSATCYLGAPHLLATPLSIVLCDPFISVESYWAQHQMDLVPQCMRSTCMRYVRKHVREAYGCDTTRIVWDGASMPPGVPVHLLLEGGQESPFQCPGARVHRERIALLEALACVYQGPKKGSGADNEHPC